jgi:hypothetical protein
VVEGAEGVEVAEEGVVFGETGAPPDGPLPGSFTVTIN